MPAKPDLTNIANQDWTQYDFTRWNLEGLKLDPQPAALAAWVRDVTLSAQGSQTFAAGLAKVTSGALQDLQDQATVMEGRISAADSELKARQGVVQKQIAVFEEHIRVASAPVVPTPDSETFQISTRVMDESTSLGLPGLQVRLYDAQASMTTIATAITDQNGNAVFKLDRPTTETLGKGNSTIAIEVLTSANKSVFTGGAAPAPRLKRTGTIVATLPSSPDISSNVAAANAAAAQQQALLGAARARVGALDTYYQQLKADLQQQLANVQAMVADLKALGTSS
jgi:5-hydroxyisourate hydrolase-like protein (transthyretin family)